MTPESDPPAWTRDSPRVCLKVKEGAVVFQLSVPSFHIAVSDPLPLSLGTSRIVQSKSPRSPLSLTLLQIWCLSPGKIEAPTATSLSLKSNTKFSTQRLPSVSTDSSSPTWSLVFLPELVSLVTSSLLGTGSPLSAFLRMSGTLGTLCYSQGHWCSSLACQDPDDHSRCQSQPCGKETAQDLLST